jgi:hypothetical protein
MKKSHVLTQDIKGFGGGSKPPPNPPLYLYDAPPPTWRDFIPLAVSLLAAVLYVVWNLPVGDP